MGARIDDGAELLRVEAGTHVSVWTDPGSADLQERIAGHVR